MRQNAVVIFDSNTSTFTIQPQVVVVPNQATLNLVFTLVTVGSSSAAEAKAEFKDPPVIFPTGGPPGAVIQKTGPTRATVTETNDNQTPYDIAYCYQVSVSYDGGDFLSPDPHIINLGEPPNPGDMRPGGGGGSVSREDMRRAP